MSAVATAAPPPSLPRGYVSPLLAVLAGSALLWAVLFASIGLAQDFPLNDDWAFGRGLFEWVEGHGIHYFSWASMPELGQWLWAYGFVQLLGPTFVALRISTVVLSWLGLWAFYDLLRQQGYSAGRSALVTAALAFNPLFVLLQGTFMTDVPALSFALIALALYQRAMRRERWAWLLAAVLSALLAVSTRQNTIVVPLVAGLLLWRKPTLRWRPLWLLGVLVPVVVAVLIHLWFRSRKDIVPVHFQSPEPKAFMQLCFFALVYCGVAVLPVMALHPAPGSWRWFVIVLAVLAGGAWLLRSSPKDLPYEGGLFPYLDNMVSPWGAFAPSPKVGEALPEKGPWSPEAIAVCGERPLILGLASRLTLTVLGCIAGSWLLVRACCKIAEQPFASPLVLFTLLQAALLVVAGKVYDRYLLFLFPGALALALSRAPLPRWRWLPATGLVAAFAIVSVALMHDWLAWNVPRWQLGKQAVASGIYRHDIEGGFEWDGLYSPDPTPEKVARKLPGLALPFTHFALGHIRGHYALSFSVLPKATRVIASRPYRLWLAPGQREFYLLEDMRSDADQQHGK